ncbi:IclR helix-turn-helix domain protein [uncultured Desulfatiglans sp.]|uniref:IclR helix-turn-helix domain protein n=1 Tax=Uncultured Desulfatiglans sp. TaxID=1748965 RepID=A0A653ADX7_UNCDX|nr:IclR helix-turn-helix domain protein [uncultured Desulfatiglans sp.]
MGENQRGAPALSRGLKILEVLAAADGELSFSSLKETSQVPGPSLWRLLHVLRDTGYVLYDPKNHTYRLGYKFLYMRNLLLDRIGFRSEARHYLRKLVDLTGETAEFSGRVKDELVLLDQDESPQAVRLFSRIGSTYPYFHATAPGKVYLAYMPEGRLESVIERIGLPAITEYTVTDFGVLKQQLAKVRAEGYAVDHQEMRLGVFRIASPVFGADGKVVACLGVAGPSFRLDDEKENFIGGAVKHVAEELSREVSQR